MLAVAPLNADVNAFIDLLLGEEGFPLGRERLLLPSPEAPVLLAGWQEIVVNVRDSERLCHTIDV